MKRDIGIALILVVFLCVAVGVTYKYLSDAQNELRKLVYDKDNSEVSMRDLVKEEVQKALHSSCERENSRRRNMRMPVQKMNAMLKLKYNGPSTGAPNSPVTVAEFFNYECSYCKSMNAIKQKVLRKYGPNIRYVFQDFPSPGAGVLASKAALAVYMIEPQKFFAMHDMLLNENVLNERTIMECVKKLGINSEAFNKAITNKEVSKQIAVSVNLARSANIMGTPAYIINGRLLLGELSYEELSGYIEHALRSSPEDNQLLQK